MLYLFGYYYFYLLLFLSDCRVFYVPKRYDLLKVIVSKYCVQKWPNVNDSNSDELEPHLAKHQWNLNLWVLILKATLIPICCFTLNLKRWAQLNIILWDSADRTFYVSRPKYVVTNYHTELLQMITILELVNLSISDYSRTLDDSYSLLKSDVAD
jgi:hypothetical protein